jgi:ubiquinone/menaquinone biosynthesis C-methylase UbiE
MVAPGRLISEAKVVSKIELPKDSKIIDMGCGTGSLAAACRRLGYSRSVGIDTSQSALDLCSLLFALEQGKDTFLMDARRTEFPDGCFDLVFSEGLLEHFENCLDMAGEFCRISRKWVLLFQPDQATLFSRLRNLWWRLARTQWVKEYPYSKQDYVRIFAQFGFNLVASGSINFQEEMWLLFARERVSAK